MNVNASFNRQASCHHCAHLFRLIHLDIREIKSQTHEIHSTLLQKDQDEAVYRDAAYVMERVGISRSTLLREQKKGNITVADIRNRRRLYLDNDVELLRKKYWRLQD